MYKLEWIVLQNYMIKLLRPADGISLINIGCGFLAILLLLSPYISNDALRFHLALIFILLALLADGLDGIIARKTGKGPLGEYFEAMGDMTSMGLALPLFVYIMYQTQIIQSFSSYLFLLVVLLLYVCCTVIRLAAFHPMKSKDSFIGLPASAGTIILLTLSFIHIEFIVLILLMIAISLLMISPIRFPKSNVKENTIATLCIFLTMLFGHQFNNIAPLLLCIATVGYVIFGPVSLLYAKRKSSS